MPEEELRHGSVLGLRRCPHCKVARPNLANKYELNTADHKSLLNRHWVVYVCTVCGGAVLAAGGVSETTGGGVRYNKITEIYPGESEVSEAVPDRARRFLTQAGETLHAPDGSVMVAASAVDAMLKEKGYKAGSLYSRIDKAVEGHVITREMAQWAHQVRLDANDPRHADEASAPHTLASAKLVYDFATALAEFLFVLPARVTRGVTASAPREDETPGTSTP